MALSKFIALFFAFAVAAATLQLSEGRVQGFKAASVDQEVPEPAIAASHEVSQPSSKAAAGGGGFPDSPLPSITQIPGFPLPLPQIPGFPGFPPLFGFPFLPLPQIPGFPSFPPLFGPLPGTPGAPPSSALPGFPSLPPIPNFPPLFGPLPGTPGAPSSGALPGFPHLPPISGSPGSPSAPPSQPLPGLPTLPPMLGFPSLPGSPPSPPPPKECQTPLMGMMPCMDYLTNITVPTPSSTCCDGFKSVISDAPICLCHGMNGGMNKIFPKPIDPIRMLILPARCGTMIPMQTVFMCFTQAVPPLTPPSSSSPTSPPASPSSEVSP